MKALQSLLAATFALFLVSTPALVFAAGSITFSNPTASASLSGAQSYSIAGTVSPAPRQADNVFIQVKNPTGTIVDAASVSANTSTGAFTYATATGGSSSWVSGKYTITATDSFGATGSATFSYATMSQTTTTTTMTSTSASTSSMTTSSTMSTTSTPTTSSTSVPTTSTTPASSATTSSATISSATSSSTASSSITAIPEFPVQLGIVLLVTVVIVASYVVTRRVTLLRTGSKTGA